ncbi:hypothetical protein niasHT_009367 [Heterodera trifolii]|uniref:RNA-directed DNA polymerase n=1 Tax=Heterodera trifolii TaxID=157864 RepID=A0ABD2M3M9_9BILA
MNDKTDYYGSTASRPRTLLLAFSYGTTFLTFYWSFVSCHFLTRSQQFFCIPIAGTQSTRISIAGLNPPAFQSPGLKSPAFQSPGLNPQAFQSPEFHSPGLNPPAFQSPGLNSPAFQSLHSNHCDSTHKLSNHQNFTRRDSIHQHSNRLDSILRHSNRLDSILRHSNHRDSIHKLSNHQNFTRRDSIHQHSNRLDSILRHSNHRDSIHKLSNHQNFTRRDSIHQQSSHWDPILRHSNHCDSTHQHSNTGTQSTSFPINQNFTRRDSILRHSNHWDSIHQHLGHCNSILRHSSHWDSIIRLLNSPAFQSVGLNPPAFRSLQLNSSAFKSPGLNPNILQNFSFLVSWEVEPGGGVLSRFAASLPNIFFFLESTGSAASRPRTLFLAFSFQYLIRTNIGIPITGTQSIGNSNHRDSTSANSSEFSFWGNFVLLYEEGPGLAVICFKAELVILQQAFKETASVKSRVGSTNSSKAGSAHQNSSKAGSAHRQNSSKAELARQFRQKADKRTAYFSKFTDLRQKCLQRLEDSRTSGRSTSLQDLGEECRKYQILKESALSLSSNPCSTSAIRAKPQKIRDKQKPKTKQQSQKGQNFLPKNSTATKGKVDRRDQPCYSCGGISHWQKDCWFKNSTCEKCGRNGHIAKACKSGTEIRRVRAVATDSGNDTHIHTVSIKPKCMAIEGSTNKWWEVIIQINGIDHPMNFDTAAQITVIKTDSWQKLGKPKLGKTAITVRNCNEKAFPIEGKFKCQVSYKGRTASLIAYVSDEIHQDLLGMPWIEELEIIPKELMFPSSSQNVNSVPTKPISSQISDEKSLISALQTNYGNTFGPELGHCTKFRAHLILKKEAKPVYCKARPVPHGALDEVNAEIDRLLKIGAIKSIEFSHWAAPILAVKKKSGKTQVCNDFPTGLNDAIELHRHPLPRPEDIYKAVAGAKFFSRLDLRDAYLQLELSDASKNLCVLNTHRGLFQCQRLPFGVKSAPAIFQGLMDKIIAGIPGAFVYLDDVVIANKSLIDHISTIFAVFNKISEYRLRIQLEKCSFLQNETLFLGHIISENGIRPDPSRAEAIEKMPAPTDKSTLRSFLGALTYYGKFIKPMRELRGPLDELLKKEAKWEWGAEQQKSFKKAKEIMLSHLLLTHFDPKMPIVVAADASKDGIGATISHVFPDKSERVIEHASCTFNAAQQNYSQIEKEALGLVFAVQKFHRVLYGRKFTLLTDHKPLLAIFGSKKGIPIYAASRLQRWALILLNYEFDIKYVNTNSFGNADVLSRLIANYPRPDEDCRD